MYFLGTVFIAMATSGWPAYGYVGPGAGLSMIGAFFALVGGIILALAMVLAYPIRRMLKRRKDLSAPDKDQ